MIIDSLVFDWSAKLSTSDIQVSEIRREITRAAAGLRKRHMWLGKFQDAIGLAIFVGAAFGVVWDAWAYFEGLICWWICIPLNMFWLSLLHELEHDLIHQIFFRRRAWVRHGLLAVGWLFRPNTINPWIRRGLHFHHHKASGTPSDLEEFGLSNGQPWGAKRLLMLWDTVAGYLVHASDLMQVLQRYALEVGRGDRSAARRVIRVTKMAFLPVTNFFYLLWHGLIIYLICSAVARVVGVDISVGPSLGAFVGSLKFLGTVLFAPNILRSFCLYFVSSNIHYFGDIEVGDMVRQTQVWTAPWTIPLNLFSFNFGGTHAIHHFVVREPFYVRQAIAPTVYPAMRRNGVRFNDFGTFRRANRWS